MEFNKAFDDSQNKLLDQQARASGLYQLDEALRTSKPAYPWAPGSNQSRGDKSSQKTSPSHIYRFP